MTGWKVLLLTVTALIAGISSAEAEKRIAFIIGNANYVGQKQLSNPANDARLIANILQRKGFEIVGGGPLVDATQSQFLNALNQFALAADASDVALFYYSGHGSASGEVNYLVTSDNGNVSASEILRRLTFAHAKLRILLLDACRTQMRIGGGFVTMSAPEGTLIGFATQPGDTASDGPPGSNSPYAASLAEAMNTPGADLFTLFNDVGLKVMKRTGSVQKPWMHASPISGTFFFSPPVFASASLPSSVAVATATDVIPAPLQAAPISAPVPQIQVSSGNAGSFIQQAWNELAGGNYESARTTLTEGIRVDSNSALAYSYMGFAWFEQGNSLRHEIMLIKDVDERNRRLSDLIKSHYAPAFVALDRAIKLNDGYSSFYRHRGNAVIGVYHTRRALGLPVVGTMDRAIVDLEAATKTDPASMLAANDLGTAYLLADRYDDAIRSYNNALLINPRYKDPHDGLCRAYMRLGRISDAQNEAGIAAQASEFGKKQCLRTEVRVR